MGYDEVRSLDWEWQAVDGVMTEAPFGVASGSNPTDRGKQGTKRSLLTEGQGIPVGVVVAGANRRDMKLLASTLEGMVILRPEPSEAARQHLSMDLEYDYPRCRSEAESRGDEVPIPSRGRQRRDHGEGSRVRRWVLERTHRRLNRSRRLLVRWEKKVENSLAFIHLACAQLIFGKLCGFRWARRVSVPHCSSHSRDKP